MSRVYLATYSAGEAAWKSTRERLVKQAIETGWFDEVFSLDKTFLDKAFSDKYADILNKAKGAGYWIWKPHIIQKCLETMRDGDILFYLDAGCTINGYGQGRFKDYIDIIEGGKSGSLAFQLNQVEKWWSVREIFRYFTVDTSSYIANSGQLIGGIFGIQKRYNGQQLIREMISALAHDPLMFTDAYGSEDQLECFRQNRHDQSVFSITRKVLGSEILGDETSHLVYGDEHSKLFPFWASRIKPNSAVYRVLSDNDEWNRQLKPSSDLIYGLEDINHALKLLGMGIGRIKQAEARRGSE